MVRPDWILFDVGGVLLDWRTSSAAVANSLNVTQDVLLEAMFKYAPLMNIGTLSPDAGWQKILHELGKNKDPWQVIHQWRSTDYWMQDTLKLLRELDEAHYGLAILSNSWLGFSVPGEADTFPAEIKLFKHIFDSSNEGIKKPDIAFYKLAESRLGAQGQSILFIDDDADNLVAADGLHWQTFHYKPEQENIPVNNEKIRRRLLS